MQTFLPYPQFRETARVLDNKRLGKQRVEAMQILNALSDPSNRWRNHVAVRMWRGYEPALMRYHNVMIQEWIARGFTNKMKLYNVSNPPLPPWLHDPRLSLSHRCNLVRKLPEHYGPLWSSVDVNAPYWWPVALKNPLKQMEMTNYWRKD